MATAVQEGLIVPVIHRADHLNVRGIASRARELAAKARDRKLVALDCDGATFTVSNLGMLGVDSFVAIINPPQAASRGRTRLRRASSRTERPFRSAR